MLRITRHRVRAATAPLALAATLAAACDPVPQTGTLQVAWRTGQSACDEAGVARVRAELFGYQSVEPAASDEAPCTDGALTLADVPAGDFSLRLAGLDGDGCFTHEAFAPQVEVPAGGVASVEALPLLRRKRPLHVRWPFANELDCQGNGVEQVVVAVEVEDLYSKSFAVVCPGLAYDVVDPELPRGRLTVSVTGLDDRGTAVARGMLELPASSFVDEPCAPVIEARVSLTPCPGARCGDR